jgi:mRNA interferase RelE/StbE
VKYRLVYTNRAIKDIKNLDAATRRRVGNTLLKYEQNPLLYAEKLTDSKLGTHRFRTGDYRIVFDIPQDEKVVLRVGHRREIYKR